MRKLVPVISGALLAGAAGLVAFGGAAQSAAAPATPAVQGAAVAPGRAYDLAAGDTANLKGPRQPIFFRHDVHAGQFKVQCQYCHYSVGVSSEPGVPTVQTCMGCHLVIGGTAEADKAEIKKLRDAWNNKQPIEWVRVHYLARHAHFPHNRHIKAMGPNACATCHGDVARMPQVYKVNNVNNMGWCINCHLERKVTRDCTSCHY